MNERSDVYERWQGKGLGITDPLALQAAAQKGPVEIFRCEALPHPIGAVSMQLSTRPNSPDGRHAYLYSATVALCGEPDTLRDRWKEQVFRMHNKGRFGDLEFAEMQLSSDIGLRMPLVFDAVASLRNEEEVHFSNDLPAGRVYRDVQLQLYPVHTPEDATYQLLRFLRAASVVVDMCAAMGKNQPWDRASRRFRFPLAPLRVNYHLGGRHTRRIAHHKPTPKAPTPPQPAPGEAEVSSSPKQPSVNSSHKETNNSEPDDLIGSYTQPKLSMHDLYLPPHVQEQIDDILALSGENTIAKEWGVTPHRRLLLYGPPGTGKTSIAHALADTLGAVLWQVGPEDIYHKYVGESEQALAEMFDQADKITSPTVLLLDEFDGFIGGTDTENNRLESAINNILRRRLPRLGENAPHLLTIATTNASPDDIDPSITRDGRFKRLYVPLPDEKGRTHLFAICLQRFTSKSIFSEGRDIFNKEMQLFAGDVDFKALAKASYEMSGATIHEIIRSTLITRAKQHIRSNQRPAAITHQDLLHAIQRQRVNE